MSAKIEAKIRPEHYGVGDTPPAVRVLLMHPERYEVMTAVFDAEPDYAVVYRGGGLFHPGRREEAKGWRFNWASIIERMMENVGEAWGAVDVEWPPVAPGLPLVRKARTHATTAETA